MKSATIAQKYSLGCLIDDLDGAMKSTNIEERVQSVRSVMEKAVSLGSDLIPKHFEESCDQAYARRLLHMDPEGRYTLMAMVWKKGQATPLHDHDGLWVVECVYKGRIRVTDYHYTGEKNGLHQFKVQKTAEGKPGVSEFRIPPFEHHILANAQQDDTVTLHVFGGPMVRCGIYEQVEGGWRRSEKLLKLTA